MTPATHTADRDIHFILTTQIRQSGFFCSALAFYPERSAYLRAELLEHSTRQGMEASSWCSVGDTQGKPK